jgi:hypothetical protein
MGSAPNIPPGNTAVPPFWRNEEDWIVLIEFPVDYDEEDRAHAAESIGYMLGYAQMTNTRMLALVGRCLNLTNDIHGCRQAGSYAAQGCTASNSIKTNNHGTSEPAACASH